MTLPLIMRHIATDGAGAADIMHIATGPLPPIGENDVLIQVDYAGVNRPDLLQRAGSYAPPPGASPIIGLEVSGTIAAVGAKVTQWKSGDAVCALTPGGGYAEFALAPAAHCLPVPAGFSMLQAASLPETVFTVWINVFERSRLAPGETFLVQGGSSGIGVTAIQMARAFGHRVFATAGSAEKCRACEQLGAERGINYRDEDFVAVIKELTGGRGVDVILDMVGGDYVPRELNALATDGRLALIAFLGGTTATIDMSQILYRRLSISGSTLRPRSIEFKSEIAATLRSKVWPLLEAGKLKPVIHSVFGFADAARAHALMESSVHVGKIMLQPASSAG